MLFVRKSRLKVQPLNEVVHDVETETRACDPRAVGDDVVSAAAGKAGAAKDQRGCDSAGFHGFLPTIAGIGLISPGGESQDVAPVIEARIHNQHAALQHPLSLLKRFSGLLQGSCPFR